MVIAAYQAHTCQGVLRRGCHLQLVAKMFPGKASIMQVIKTARTFWDRHPNQYIAIHCAYGGLLFLSSAYPSCVDLKAPSHCIVWFLQSYLNLA